MIQKLNTTQKKQSMQNTTRQNYPGSVTFYNTRPGNEVGYNAPEPTQASKKHLQMFTYILQARYPGSQPAVF